MTARFQDKVTLAWKKKPDNTVKNVLAKLGTGVWVPSAESGVVTCYLGSGTLAKTTS